MGPLVGIGGVAVPGGAVKTVEDLLDAACRATGFPPGEPFKWSPGREMWMHQHLVGDARQEFFIHALRIVRDAGSKAIVVIEGEDHRTATRARTHEADVTRLSLERANNHLVRSADYGVVVVARPSGDRREEGRFLAGCLETLQMGTDFVRPERIAINVLSTPARLVRLLQVADIITSCTMAFVAGENQFSPPVFAEVRAALLSNLGRIGGVGLKLHPDFIFANLYHWLVGDMDFWKLGMGVSLPLPTRPYSRGPDAP